MHEQVYKYEEVNLKIYAKDDKQLERYGLFRNVIKAEVKEKLETLPAQMMNPFKTMRLWIKWELMDIQAINEAVEIRSQIETLKISKAKKRENYQKELEQLNQGKSSFKTLFSSKEGKVNRITELGHKISNGEKELDAFDLYLKIVVLQINQAAIPFFK